MTIVVLAHANDNHTAPLKWALEQAGYKVACWAGLASAEERQASITFEENIQLTLGTHVLSPGDVVWVRRPNPAVLNPRVSEADKKFAEGEYRWFYHTIMYQLETLPVHCINKYSASRFINNKSVQILLARNCGMHVPKTLFSNSPAAVRAFLGQAGRRSICKAFFPHIWQKDNSPTVAVTETFEVTPEMLPADEVLTYAPAIYQDMVVKEFDVRMVRRWWFLEINEQGQFLWLDEFNHKPDIMGKFLAFLTAPDNSQKSIEERQSLFPSLKEYRQFEEKEPLPTEEIPSSSFVSAEP